MLADNLRRYRQKLRINRTELARRAGISRQAVGNYENGLRTPGMPVVMALGEALGVTAAELLQEPEKAESIAFDHRSLPEELSREQKKRLTGHIESALSRILTMGQILGSRSLPPIPRTASLALSGDATKDACRLRKSLAFPEDGIIENLAQALEVRGFLVFAERRGPEEFASSSGFAGKRPYIAVNWLNPAVDVRLAMASEAVRLMFRWPARLAPTDAARARLLVGGAFLGGATRVPEEPPSLFHRLANRITSEKRLSLTESAELLKRV